MFPNKASELGCWTDIIILDHLGVCLFAAGLSTQAQLDGLSVYQYAKTQDVKVFGRSRALNGPSHLFDPFLTVSWFFD
jgi:hypothetical protein